MGFSGDSAIKFSKSLDRIGDDLPDVSNNQIAIALGLDKDGMNSALRLVRQFWILLSPIMRILLDAK